MILPRHLPVMVREVVLSLHPSPFGLYGDLTIGEGGHAEAILEASSPEGRLIGIDRDLEAIELSKERLSRFGDRVTLIHDRFSRILEHMEGLNINGFDGLVMDLGVSTVQLTEPGRGFSFSAAGPLDMRMDRSQKLTAEHLVNSLSAGQLEKLIRGLGEERFAGRIAKAIVRKRPFRDTLGLARAVVEALGSAAKGHKLHPATRVFQALRIAVNEELNELETTLDLLPRILKPGGKAVVISFHSLEDRIVKTTFKKLAAKGKGAAKPPSFRLLTDKAMRPSRKEVLANPRARSAKLRAIERI